MELVESPNHHMPTADPASLAAFRAAKRSHPSCRVLDERALTQTEIDVARFLVGGASNREIAARLFMSVRTVEAHLTRIFRKHSVRSRTEFVAVHFAGGAGLRATQSSGT